MKYMTLSALPLSKAAYIYDINTDEALSRRLWDFGFVTGHRIIPLFKSPLGDLRAYSVMGSVVALRGEIAEKIIVSQDKEDIQ